MNPRLALYLSAALLLTAISPGQATGGTIASQAADSTLSNVDPATGREALYNRYVPVLDHHGRAVTADLATSEAIAITFIAHCDRFQLVAQGLTGEDGLMFSLLPLP